MYIILAILIVQLIVVAVVLSVLVLRLSKDVRDNTAETRELRLMSRTRISTISTQSGATTEEQILRRLGRASTGRRIVVGGDRDSQLHKDLTTAEERD